VPANGFSKFDFFRKTVIQKINQELPYFFEEQEHELIVINLLNVCFSIFNKQIIEKIQNKVVFEKTEFFNLLFYTACFIVVKVNIKINFFLEVFLLKTLKTYFYIFHQINNLNLNSSDLKIPKKYFYY
jgi:hypothetical protein